MRSVEPWYATAVTLLACSTLGLAIFFFGGFYGFDDWQYSAFLRSMVHGGDVSPTLGAARWLISLPYAAYGLLFGLEPYWAVSLHSLQYLVLVLATVGLTRMLASRSASLAAGTLAATCPLIALYSGILLPDILTALLIVAEIAFVLFAYRARDRRRTLLWCAAAGFTHAMVFITKEPGVIFVLAAPILVVALFLRERRLGLQAAGTMAAGFLVGAGLDMALSAMIFGDPIVRLTRGSSEGVMDHARNAMQRQGTYPLDRINRISGNISSQWTVMGVGAGAPFIYASLLAPLLLLAPIFRRFDVLVLSTTLFAAVAYHTFGTLSLREYVGIWLNPRYYAPAAILAFVLAALAVDRLLAISPWPRANLAARLVLLGASVVLGVLFVAGSAHHAKRIFDMELTDEVHAAPIHIGARHPGIPIVAGPFITSRILRFGPIPGLERSRQFDDALRRNPEAVIVLMHTSEGDPSAKGIMPEHGYRAIELAAEEHGLWMWQDRPAALRAAFGKPDPDALQPPQQLRIYRVEREGT